MDCEYQIEDRMTRKGVTKRRGGRPRTARCSVGMRDYLSALASGVMPQMSPGSHESSEASSESESTVCGGYPVGANYVVGSYESMDFSFPFVVSSKEVTEIAINAPYNVEDELGMVSTYFTLEDFMYGVQWQFPDKNVLLELALFVNGLYDTEATPQMFTGFKKRVVVDTTAEVVKDWSPEDSEEVAKGVFAKMFKNFTSIAGFKKLGVLNVGEVVFAFVAMMVAVSNATARSAALSIIGLWVRNHSMAKMVTKTQQVALSAVVFSLWEVLRRKEDAVVPQMEGGDDVVGEVIRNLPDSKWKHAVRHVSRGATRQPDYAAKKEAAWRVGLRDFNSFSSAIVGLDKLGQLAKTYFDAALDVTMEDPDTIANRYMSDYIGLTAMFVKSTPRTIGKCDEAIAALSTLLVVEAKTKVNVEHLLERYRQLKLRTVGNVAASEGGTPAFVMTISGDAGVGKSTLIETMFAAIASADPEQVPGYDPSNVTSFAFGLEQYDHYTFQENVYMDDALALFDETEEGRANRSKFQDLADGNVVLLHAKEMDLKKTLYARFRSMIFIQNTPELIGVAALPDPQRQAINRRIRLHIAVRRVNGQVQWSHEEGRWRDDDFARNCPLVVYEAARRHFENVELGTRQIRRAQLGQMEKTRDFPAAYLRHFYPDDPVVPQMGKHEVPLFVHVGLKRRRMRDVMKDLEMTVSPNENEYFIRDFYTSVPAYSPNQAHNLSIVGAKVVDGCLYYQSESPQVITRLLQLSLGVGQVPDVAPAGCVNIEQLWSTLDLRCSKTQLRSYLQGKTDWGQLVGWVALGVAVIGAISAGVTMATRAGAVKEQSGHAKDGAKKKVVYQRLSKPEVTPQMGSGMDYKRQFAESLSKKFIQVANDSGGKVNTFLVTIGEKSYFVVVSHFLATLRDSGKIAFVMPSRTDEYNWMEFRAKFEVKYHGSRDIALLEAPLPAMAKDITDSLSSFDSASHHGVAGYHVAPDAICAVSLSDISCAGVYKYHMRSTLRCMYHGITTTTPLAKEGACGSVYVVGTKIIGYHVAGSRTFGVADIISYEYLESIVKEEVGPLSLRDAVASVPPLVRTMVDETVPSPFPSRKTELVPVAPTFGVLADVVGYPREQLKVPAELDWIRNEDGSVTHPAVEALANCAEMTERGITVDVSSLLECSGPVVDALVASAMKHGVPVGPFSLQDVIVGNGVLPPMDLKTAGGHDVEGRSGTKERYARVENGRAVVDPAVERVVLHAVKMILDGAPWSVALPWAVQVFKGSLKDETRRRGKLARLTAGVSFALQLVMRMLFGDILEVVKREPVSTSLGVGINPASADWASIYGFLGEDVLDADAAGWDASTPADVKRAVGLVFAQYYMRRGSSTLQVAAEQFSDWFAMTYVSYGPLVWKFSGIPSGIPLTSVIDGIAFFLVWTRSVAKVKGMDLGECAYLLKSRGFIDYGDDVVASDFVTPGEVPEVLREMKRVGFTLTSASDKSKPARVVKRSEITFLGRRFVPEGGRVLCPLTDSTFANMMNYRDKDLSDDQFVNAAAVSAITEAALMGAVVYGNTCRALGVVASRYGIELSLPVTKLVAAGRDEVIRKIYAGELALTGVGDVVVPQGGGYLHMEDECAVVPQMMGQLKAAGMRAVAKQKETERQMGRAKKPVLADYKRLQTTPVSDVLHVGADLVGGVGDSVWHLFSAVGTLLGLDCPVEQMKAQMCDMWVDDECSAGFLRSSVSTAGFGDGAPNLPEIPRETDIQAIAGRFGRVHTTTVAGAATVGTAVVTDLPISPCVVPSLPSTVALSTYVRLLSTPASPFTHITSGHTYSAAIVRVKFIFPLGYQKGVYRITYTPTTMGGADTITASTTAFLPAVIDVDTSDTWEVTFRIPKINIRANFANVLLLGNADSAASSVASTWSNDSNTCLGALNIYVLQAQTCLATPVAVKVQVYYAWEDFLVFGTKGPLTRDSQLSRWTVVPQMLEGATEVVTAATVGEIFDQAPPLGVGTLSAENALAGETFNAIVTASGSISSAGGTVTSIWPRSWVETTAIASRLAGIMYFRADVEYTLQFTASPATAGYVVLAAIPYGQLYGTEISNYTLVELLEMFPSASASLGSTRSLSLRLPWNGMVSHYQLTGDTAANMKEERYMCGYVVVVLFQAMVSAAGSSSSVSYALYQRPYNVHGCVRFPGTVVPQMLSGIGGVAASTAVLEPMAAGVPSLRADVEENNENALIKSVKVFIQRPSNYVITQASLTTTEVLAANNFIGVNTNMALAEFPYWERSVTNYEGTVANSPYPRYMLISDMFAFRAGVTHFVIRYTSPRVRLNTAYGTTLGSVWQRVVASSQYRSLTGNFTGVDANNAWLTGNSRPTVYAGVVGQYRYGVRGFDGASYGNNYSVDRGGGPIKVSVPFMNPYGAIFRSPMALDWNISAAPRLVNVAIVNHYSESEGSTAGGTLNVTGPVYDVSFYHGDDVVLYSWRPFLGFQMTAANIANIRSSLTGNEYTIA